MASRTFVIGDIHGELVALERLLAKFPALTTEDTVVFLGDYVDRGPCSLGVVERVRGLSGEVKARIVALRGNHEDMWLRCFEGEDAGLGFLVPPSNGCGNTYRSFTGQAPLTEVERLNPEEFEQYTDVPAWFPRHIFEWMSALPLWYEDEHAIYVHAGVEGGAGSWKHPRDCARIPLLWMRERDFFTGYRGKRLLFGHTLVKELPPPDLSFWGRLFDDPNDVWVNHDLIGLDTGCGKGGFLSAIELPLMKVYESR